MEIKTLTELKEFLSTETDTIKICNEDGNDVSFVFKTIYSFSYTGLPTKTKNDIIYVKAKIHRSILFNKFKYLGEDYVNHIEVHSPKSRSVSTIISSREDSIKEIQENDLMSQKGKDAKIEESDKYYSIAISIATYVESDEFKEIFDKEMAKVKIEKVLYVDSSYDRSGCDCC